MPDPVEYARDKAKQDCESIKRFSASLRQMWIIRNLARYKLIRSQRPESDEVLVMQEIKGKCSARSKSVMSTGEPLVLLIQRLIHT